MSPIGQPISRFRMPAVALAVHFAGGLPGWPSWRVPVSEEERERLQNNARGGFRGLQPSEPNVANLRVWDVTTGRAIGGAGQPVGLEQQAPMVRFGPPRGGTVAFYVGEEGRMWNLTNGNVTPLPPLPETVQSVERNPPFADTTAIGPGGRLLGLHVGSSDRRGGGSA